MSLPIFAYDNILTSGTVTATSEQSDFPVSNLTNWKPTRWWKAALIGTQYINIDAGELVDVDYFGVFSHDLEEKGASLYLQNGTKNLYIYSEDFDNTVNVKTNITNTNDSLEVAGMTMNLIKETAVDSSHRLVRNDNISEETIYTIQVKLKAKERKYGRLRAATNIGYIKETRFDLESGTASGDGEIELISDGVYLLSLTFTTQSGATSLSISGVHIWDTVSGGSSGGDAYLGDGTSGFYADQLQLEEGALGDYVATTSSQIVGGYKQVVQDAKKSNSEVIFETFDTINGRYFRVAVVSPTEICSIGVIGIGQYTSSPRGLQKGFIPPHMNTKNKNLINVADGGLPIGSSVIRIEASLEASIQLLSVDWIRSIWETIMAHAENNPMFFSWNDSEYPDEAVFTMIDTTKTRASYIDKSYMSLKISGKAWHKL